MRARVLWTLLAIGMLSLPACRREKRLTIAVIPKATSHMFWASTEAGARAAGRELNVEVLWNGPAMETDYSRQIQVMDSMISRRVDGIAIAVTERKALVPPVERAAAEGIPVTIFDSGLDTEKYLTFVSTNNYAAGQMAAREMARLIGGKGSVAILASTPGSYSTTDREKGFADAAAKEFPGMRIVALQFGMSDRAKAMAATENILGEHPGLSGLFASSEPSSVGAAVAIKARRLSGKLKFISFDSSDSMIEDLREGTISAMMVQDPFRIGFEAVKSLADKLRGGNPPRRMDLNAVVVHASDLDKPEIKQLLSPGVKKYLNQ